MCSCRCLKPSRPLSGRSPASATIRRRRPSPPCETAGTPSSQRRCHAAAFQRNPEIQEVAVCLPSSATLLTHPVTLEELRSRSRLARIHSPTLIPVCCPRTAVPAGYRGVHRRPDSPMVESGLGVGCVPQVLSVRPISIGVIDLVTASAAHRLSRKRTSPSASPPRAGKMIVNSALTSTICGDGIQTSLDLFMPHGINKRMKNGIFWKTQGLIQ